MKGIKSLREMQKTTLVVVIIAGGVLALAIVPGIVSKLTTVQLPEIKNLFESESEPTSKPSPELIYGNISAFEIEYQRQMEFANMLLTTIPYVTGMVVVVVIIFAIFMRTY